MPTSTSVVTVQQRTSSKGVSLTTIDKYGAGLVGIEGAKEIVETISKRRNVTKLILDYNDLGDNGACELFHYLASESGRKYKVAEIGMRSTLMGDHGLAALAKYLSGNEHMRELSLQNNELTGDPETVLAFVSALNTSCVELLNLDANHNLSDDFVSLFLSNLNTPHLRALHISILGLTSTSTPYILDFLRSHRSRNLETFKCNGNSLGLESIQSVVSLLLKSNATLQHAEFFANFAPAEAKEDGKSPARRKMWEEAEAGLKKVVTRNALLKKKVWDEAAGLLPYARALLIRLERQEARSNAQPISGGSSLERHTTTKLNISSPVSPASSRRLPSHQTPFPFPSLPLELQHHILSFLAPILSTSQLVRIFSYASSSATLPPLLPSLRGGPGCMPDPAGMPFMMLGGGGKSPGGRARGTSIGGCSGGACMGSGSVSCHRNREKVKWLNEVGCSRCDLKEGTDVEALAIYALGRTP